MIELGLTLANAEENCNKNEGMWHGNDLWCGNKSETRKPLDEVLGDEKRNDTQ
jgi:hypothetical protein